MLRNSFIQLPGIGSIKERSLWENGILTWKDFLNNKKLNKHLKQNKSFSKIETCVNKLEKKDAIYFYKTLPYSEHWRIFKEFQSHCLYLDIETNGVDYGSGIITTIATYDGIKIKYYINGKNLHDFIKPKSPLHTQSTLTARVVGAEALLNDILHMVCDLTKK